MATDDGRYARDFLKWIVALDEMDSEERKTVTLTLIIDRARTALAASDSPSKEEILAAIDAAEVWSASSPVPEWGTDGAKEEARVANLCASFGVRAARIAVEKLFESEAREDGLAFALFEQEKAAGTLRTVPHDEVRARLGIPLDVGDKLANDFFDEKIAPSLADKGVSSEQIAHQRGMFSNMVISARSELRRIYL